MFGIINFFLATPSPTKAIEKSFANSNVPGAAHVAVLVSPSPTKAIEKPYVISDVLRAAQAAVDATPTIFCKSHFDEMSALLDKWIPHPIPFSVKRRMWSTMLNAFENGSSSDLCESVMKIFRESKLYESSKIAKSLNPPVNLMSTGIDEGAPLVLVESQQGEYGFNKILSKSNVKGESVVVDLGSNIGCTIIALARLTGNSTKVVAVEAMPVTWFYQQINLWSNVREDMLAGRVVSILAAIGGLQKKEIKFQFRADSLTSARDWNPSSEDWRTTMEVKLHTRNLEEMLEENKIPPSSPILLLKLDCEGCEYDAVPDFSENFMKRVQGVTGELHYNWMVSNKRKLPPKDKVDLTQHILCTRWKFYC